MVGFNTTFETREDVSVLAFHGDLDVATRRSARDALQGALHGDGAALVLHAKADDYMTDPSGASGDRIACAVLVPTSVRY